MPFLPSSVRAAALALALLAGCKSTTPASEQAAAGRPAGDTAPAAAAAAPAAGQDSVLVRADQGRVQGAENAPVWLVVASDFQCPYCRIWHDSTYDTLVRDYVQPGKVRMAYINFPLPMHQHAVMAAEAAMCASAQGKFWQMHSAIFRAQESWTPQADAMPAFESLAQASGADVPRWKHCMSSHATLPLVQADAERTRRSGVQSTPSFMILRGNTLEKAIAGAVPTAQFRAALDAALANANAGTP